MGGQNSKSHHSFDDSTSMRASTRSKLSNKEALESVHQGITLLKSEIDTFSGSATDERYANYQQLLAQYSQRVDSLKKEKKKNAPLCENLQRDINDCIRLLREKVEEPFNLDQGTVESNSFINQMIDKNSVRNSASRDSVDSNSLSNIRSKSLDRKIKRNKINARGRLFGSTGKLYKTEGSLDEYEEKISKVDKDIKIAIELEDTKQMFFLEKQIEILYADIELVDVEPCTPLQERKDQLFKTLVRFNRKLKKAKENIGNNRKSLHKDLPPSIKNQNQEPDPQILEAVSRAKEVLNELEVKSNNINGDKNSDSYIEVRKELDELWFQFQRYNEKDETTRKATQEILLRIKSVLRSLNARAKYVKETTYKELDIIKAEVEKFKNFVTGFEGYKNNENYKFIDQNLRKLWANIQNINDISPDVSLRKIEIIHEIQNSLKELSNKAKQPENIYAEVNKKRLSTRDDILQKLSEQEKQIEELWNDFSSQLEGDELDNEEKKEIMTKLKSFENKIVSKIDSINLLNLKYSSQENLLQANTSPTYVGKYRSYDDLKNTAVKSTNENTDFANKIFGKYCEMESKKFSSHNRTKSTHSLDLLPADEAQTIIVKSYEIPKLNKPVHVSSVNNLDDIPEEHLKNISDFNTNVSKRLGFDKECDNSYASKEEMRKIEDQVEILQSRVENFKGVLRNEEYNDIEDGLVNCIILTEKINTNNEENLKAHREKILQKIKSLQKELPKKLIKNSTQTGMRMNKLTKHEVITHKKECNEYEINEEENQTNGEEKHEMIPKTPKTPEEILEIRSVSQEVQQLKTRVDCFHGIFRDNHYLQIKESLNSCLEKVDKIDSSRNEGVQMAKSKIKQRILQYLKILEERSIKIAPENSVPVNYTVKMGMIRDDLMRIKTEMENFNGNYGDEKYKEIVSDLIRCKKITEDIEESGRDSIRMSKQDYLEYISNLSSYFEEKLEHSANIKV